VLELRGVSKRYGSVQALNECAFRAAAGRLTGFVGPNGAGKTTAMRVIFGLVSPDSGEARWNGRAIDASVRRRFGYMPEERGLYPRMRVRDQLLFFGRLSGLSSSRAGMAADRWLDALGLTDRAAARLDDLSHGNQQRVQLAAALVHDPALVVLDEPFAGLDPFAMDSMQQLLMQVAREGATVLFSSHQLDVVEHLCSHQLDVVEHLCEDVVVINSGRIAIAGRLDELRDAAASRYLDVTARGDLHPLLDLPGVIVVARDDGHVRLRVPSGTDPGRWLRAVGRDIVRVSYEPPTLSELFRTAVTDARQPTEAEVSHARA
jgi:ABC-2 type transport system ATP-binding protein